MDSFKQNIFTFWTRYKQSHDISWARDIWHLFEDAYPTVKFQKLYPHSGDCGLRLPSLKEPGKFVRFSFDNNDVTEESINKLIKMFDRRGKNKEFDESEVIARKEAEKKDLDENMKKKINESQLKSIVAESVKRVLKEMTRDDAIDYNTARAFNNHDKWLTTAPDNYDTSDVCVGIPMDDEDNINLGKEKIEEILNKLLKSERIADFDKDENENCYNVSFLNGDYDGDGRWRKFKSPKQHIIDLLNKFGIYAIEY